MSDPVDPQAFLTLVDFAVDPIYEREFVLDRLDKKGGASQAKDLGHDKNIFTSTLLMTFPRSPSVLLLLLLVLAGILAACSVSPTTKSTDVTSLPSYDVNGEKDPLEPRVPAHLRGAARKLTSPFEGYSKEASAEILLYGKRLYEGKGTCFNCHGWSGSGDGPASLMVQPGPRDFTNCQFHAQRTDGELFWVIKNGSPGTDMVSMIPNPINHEEAWKILVYVRTFCATWRKGE